MSMKAEERVVFYFSITHNTVGKKNDGQTMFLLFHSVKYELKMLLLMSSDNDNPPCLQYFVSNDRGEIYFQYIFLM